MKSLISIIKSFQSNFVIILLTCSLPMSLSYTDVFPREGSRDSRTLIFRPNFFNIYRLNFNCLTEKIIKTDGILFSYVKKKQQQQHQEWKLKAIKVSAPPHYFLQRCFKYWSIWNPSLPLLIIKTWSPFLKSPETFRAHFGWRNSLCIFKTKA